MELDTVYESLRWFCIAFIIIIIIIIIISTNAIKLIKTLLGSQALINLWC